MLCCMTELGEVDRRKLGALLSTMDVAVFLHLAIVRHRVGPLVHAVLAGLPPMGLPASLMQPLAACARANAVKALQAQRAHLLLSRLFADSAADWLPFKGITLAARYYADPSVRHVNDLDIWVPPAALAATRRALLSAGCRSLNGPLHGDLAERGPRHAAYLQRYYHEEQLCSPDLGFLELHWRLADNPYQFKLKPESVRAGAQVLTMGGAEFRVMNDVDLLLYLCDHGARHGWGRLKWLADLPRILQSRPWDWGDVLVRADAAGCRESLLLGLALSAQLLGWQPPPQVQSLLDRSRRLPLAVWLIGLSLRSPASGKDLGFKQVAALVLREIGLNLLLTTTWRSVVYQCDRYLLSPNDLQALELPDRWFGGYYLLRPFLLLARRAGVLASR
jgi:Uncharacterised nucleotidyltransferase